MALLKLLAIVIHRLGCLILTPSPILTITVDERVPVSLSYKLYHALKDNEVEVQFIAYPVGGHFPGDPVHLRDVFRRWIDWIGEHFDRNDNP
ncbi:alpha/beta hydrolase family protein [Cyclobacterium salsum]|uniref:alpha/beta hydrolase family protein n=1 Tax=Cyclobacterium salsum TaxID=2666329 RepID=UPI001391E336|nr:prolyl oligopeptidase family serine peptidase [Cyclobacterium salsum]